MLCGTSWVYVLRDTKVILLLGGLQPFVAVGRIHQLAGSGMNPVASIAFKRLIRKRLSRAVGAQVQLVSLQAAGGGRNFSGFVAAEGKLARFSLSGEGKLLQLTPQFQFFRWDRAAA